jgi:hypothetical protein
MSDSDFIAILGILGIIAIISFAIMCIASVVVIAYALAVFLAVEPWVVVGYVSYTIFNGLGLFISFKRK